MGLRCKMEESARLSEIKLEFIDGQMDKGYRCGVYIHWNTIYL